MKTPRKRKPKFGIALNEKAAAARTGFPPEFIKDAKENGCLAWHQSGRIDCDVLAAFAVTHPEMLERHGKVDKRLEDALDKRAARKLKEEKLAKIRNENTPNDEIANDLYNVGLRQKAILDEMVNNPEIVDKICVLMQELFQKYNGKPKTCTSE